MNARFFPNGKPHLSLVVLVAHVGTPVMNRPFTPAQTVKALSIWHKGVKDGDKPPGECTKARLLDLGVPVDESLPLDNHLRHIAEAVGAPKSRRKSQRSA